LRKLPWGIHVTKREWGEKSASRPQKEQRRGGENNRGAFSDWKAESALHQKKGRNKQKKQKKKKKKKKERGGGYKRKVLLRKNAVRGGNNHTEERGIDKRTFLKGKRKPNPKGDC